MRQIWRATIWRATTRCATIWCATIWRATTQCSTIWCATTQRTTIRRVTIWRAYYGVFGLPSLALLQIAPVHTVLGRAFFRLLLWH